MIHAIVAWRKGDHGIGFENKLPWRIPSDLKHFKEMTQGCSVVMGYNTMLSLGKPLPGRKNYVLTRFKERDLPEGFIGVQMVQGLRDFMAIVGKREDLWVIGGAKTYEILAEYVDAWVVTEVDAPDVQCDAFVTPPDFTGWETYDRDVVPSEKDEFPYTIRYYLSPNAVIELGDHRMAVSDFSFPLKPV